MNQTINGVDAQINTTHINSNISFCPYQLPCGYCEKLGRNCPKHTPYNPYPWDSGVT